MYNSVPLAKELVKRKTLVCGTLRRNRKFLPQAVVGTKLKKGEISRRRNERIVVIKWHDNRDVLMLSTFHTGQLTDSPKVNRRGERIRKPDCVLSYNQNMCGIDRADQLLSYYTPLRKTIRWYKKVVLNFLDMTMTNTYLLYRKQVEHSNKCGSGHKVIRALVTSQERDAATTSKTDTTLARPFFHHKSGDLSRLWGQHFLDVIPPTSTKSTAMKRCVVCYKQRRQKETRYQCETCMAKPALCVVPCFKIYHTQEEFSSSS